jgi:hypothetical protein
MENLRRKEGSQSLLIASKIDDNTPQAKSAVSEAQILLKASTRPCSRQSPPGAIPEMSLVRGKPAREFCIGPTRLANWIKNVVGVLGKRSRAQLPALGDLEMEDWSGGEQRRTAERSALTGSAGSPSGLLGMESSSNLALNADFRGVSISTRRVTVNTPSHPSNPLTLANVAVPWERSLMVSHSIVNSLISTSLGLLYLLAQHVLHPSFLLPSVKSPLHLTLSSWKYQVVFDQVHSQLWCCLLPTIGSNHHLGTNYSSLSIAEAIHCHAHSEIRNLPYNLAFILVERTKLVCVLYQHQQPFL